MFFALILIMFSAAFVIGGVALMINGIYGLIFGPGEEDPYEQR